MNKSLYDIILFGFMLLMLTFGWIFTKEGTKRYDWCKKTTGYSDKSMRTIHSVSLWGSFIAIAFFILSLITKKT